MCDKGSVFKTVLKIEKQCYECVSIVNVPIEYNMCVVYTSDQKMSSTEQPYNKMSRRHKLMPPLSKTSKAWRCVLQSSDVQTV